MHTVLIYIKLYYVLYHNDIDAHYIALQLMSKKHLFYMANQSSFTILSCITKQVANHSKTGKI